jgi:hypothetical protein
MELDVAVSTGVLDTVHLLCGFGEADIHAEQMLLLSGDKRKALMLEWNTENEVGQKTQLSCAGVRRCSQHSTVLHTAIWYGYKEILEYLLKININPNIL